MMRQNAVATHRLGAAEVLPPPSQFVAPMHMPAVDDVECQLLFMELQVASGAVIIPVIPHRCRIARGRHDAHSEQRCDVDSDDGDNWR